MNKRRDWNRASTSEYLLACQIELQQHERAPAGAGPVRPILIFYALTSYYVNLTSFGGKPDSVSPHSQQIGDIQLASFGETALATSRLDGVVLQSSLQHPRGVRVPYKRNGSWFGKTSNILVDIRHRALLLFVESFHESEPRS